MGKRIVIATLGSLGDLHPYLALASELKQNGHSVIFATNTVHKQRVEAMGFEWRRMRPEMPTNDPLLFQKLFQENTGPAYAFKKIIDPAVRESYEDLLSATARTDFLISTPLSLTGPIVAQIRQMPWASAQLQPLGFLSMYDPPVPPQLSWLYQYPQILTTLAKPLCSLTKAVTESWVQSVYHLRRDLRLSRGEHPLWEGQYSPQCALAMFSSAFATKRADWPKHVAITGFCFFDGAEVDTTNSALLQRFLQEGPAPVIVTLGSAAVNVGKAFFRDCYTALLALNQRAIFLTGTVENRAALPDTLPPQMISVDYIPYAEIFAAASVIVHQGGMGTTAQCLRAGKPMVIVPFGYDQPNNANRAKRLGVAEVVERKNANATTLADAIGRALVTDSLTHNSQKVASTIANENGPRSAYLALAPYL